MPRRNIVREINVSDEVFWTEDLIEETTKGLYDSYTILTLRGRILNNLPLITLSSFP